MIRPHYIPVNECDDSLLASHLKCCADPSFPVLGGMDVVGMMLNGSPGEPLWGLEDFQYLLETPHGAYRFFFQNQEHMDLFESDPWRYAPAAGGFAADVLAQKISTPPDQLLNSTLDMSSNIKSWVYPENHLIFTSGEQQFSVQELVQTERKVVWIWDRLFSKGDSIFNTQCLKGFSAQILGFSQFNLKEMPNKFPFGGDASGLSVVVVRGEDGFLHIIGSGIENAMHTEYTTDEKGNFEFVLAALNQKDDDSQGNNHEQAV